MGDKEQTTPREADLPKEKCHKKSPKKARRRRYFVRKEAQVQWQTLKIPFITGGPGPAESKRTSLTAAGHYL